MAVFKAEFINDFAKENGINNVIEFGCGDGNQLSYLLFKSYLGYDVSDTIIKHCKTKFLNDKTKHFDLAKNFNNETVELVLSLDVIYHLIEDEVYDNYMFNLFKASTKFVIIYSSNSDNHENNGIASHVRHREFTKWVYKNASNFKLITHSPNKFKFDGNNEHSSYADFYIFKKKNNN